MISKFWTIFSICIVTTLAIAQQKETGDYHTQSDPSRDIYSISAFAHGHRHGYEEGYHAGDEDYQLRHAPTFSGRTPKPRGYMESFGDKSSYKQGFQSGYRAGYADSYSGVEFREGRDPGLKPFFAGNSSDREKPTSSISATFNTGVAAGYREGFASQSSSPETIDSVTLKCQEDKHAQPLYCNGFGAGYALGRSDKDSIAALQSNEPAKLARNSH